MSQFEWIITSSSSSGLTASNGTDTFSGTQEAFWDMLKTLSPLPLTAADALAQANVYTDSQVHKFVECARQATGVTPLLVTEFTLPAGTYTSFTAVIGTELETTIASLEIKESDGTVLKTLTRTGAPLQVSTTGFTLAVDTLVGFYLRGDLLTTISYVFSLGVI